MYATKDGYYQSLYQLSRVLDSAHSYKEVAQSMVSGVAHAINAQACSMMLLTQDKKDLIHAAAYGLSNWYFKSHPIVFDKSISDTLLGNPVNIPSVADDDRIFYRKQVHQEGIASILSVPIKLKDTVVGILRVYSSTPYFFNEEDVSFACAAANFGAIAMEKNRSFESVQKDYELVRQQMTQLQAELDYEGDIEVTIPFKEAGTRIQAGG